MSPILRPAPAGDKTVYLLETRSGTHPLCDFREFVITVT